MLKIEQDFHGWLLDQAKALRTQDLESLDWANLAEQIESLAARERSEIKDRLVSLLIHLLMLRFEPEQVWRHNSWRNRIVEMRQQILNILEDSPSVFRGKREVLLAKAYHEARKDAARVSSVPLTSFPQENPWAYELIMDQSFFPATGTAERHSVAQPIDDFLDD